MADSFFSVSFDLVGLGRPLPFDLFINSSVLESREKFVRVLKAGDVVTTEDVQRFKSKYHQIYVKESQRSAFLRSLCDLPNTSSETLSAEAAPSAISPIDIQKTTVLKESAIHHLKTLFEQDPPTEVLSQTIVGCRDVVESMIDVLDNYDIDKLKELIAHLSFHDFYTYDHSINVSMYCIMIYRTMFPNATRQEILQAGLSGLLHDLGKIKIPTHIINNAGKLSDEDFKEIQKHPDFGYDLLTQSGLNLPVEMNPRELGCIVCQHHENFDGTGYPRKLAGDQIHIMARITAIADFFDAITTKRSYHEPLPLDEAIALMRKFEGKKIDPKVFNAFLEQARTLVKKTSRLELADDDFDPCQPHQQLPLRAAKQEAPKPAFAKAGTVVQASGSDSKTFGHVKIIPSQPQDTVGKVKVIDNGQPAKGLRKKSA